MEAQMGIGKKIEMFFEWSSDVNMWMNKGYCISKDAISKPG